MATLTATDKITPCLWFATQAEDAMDFYIHVFGADHARVIEVQRCSASGPWPEGTLLTATFELHGRSFAVLNGGPEAGFTPAVSFVVNCDTQAELDAVWEKLLAGGGRTQMCGWLSDRYGVSWQVVPRALPAMLRDPDTKRAERVVAAMMGMVKLDLPALQAAYYEA